MLLKIAKNVALRIGGHKTIWKERIIPEALVPMDIRSRSSKKDDDGMVLCLEI